MRAEHAPAKLTLSLRVTDRRDDGYHLLDAEMVTLDLADTLLFGEGEGIELVPLVRSPRFEPTLVTRALEAVGREAFVRLEKRIPCRCGLGWRLRRCCGRAALGGLLGRLRRAVARRRRAVLSRRGTGACARGGRERRPVADRAPGLHAADT